MDVIVIKNRNYNRGNVEDIFYVKEVGKHLKIEKGELNLKNIQTIISFDFFNIIDDIPISNDIHYFDLEKVNRQLIGRSKKEFSSKDYPWDIWNAIKMINYEILNISIDEFKRKLNYARNYYLGIESDININETVVFLMNCLEILYKTLLQNLNSSLERERYYSIEKKLNPILLKASKKGIFVDNKKIKNHVKEIDIEMYNQRNILQLKYGIFSNKDFENLKINLDSKIPSNINLRSKEFWSYLKINRTDHEIFDNLLLERKLTKNKTVLSRLGNLESNLIKVQFDYFGTITGRILVYNPSLQQLSRKYRDIIKSEEGKKLLYFDFCQFEAGILASESDDNLLIQMYNNTDIYEAIVKSIGEDKISRDQAKELFYSFCYGMNFQRENLFFNQFMSLIPYYEKVSSEYIMNGYISTKIGNLRYKANNVRFPELENWLISQKIQGLSSIIMKEIIIKVHNDYPEIDFLLPMHDAILYQVPNSKLEFYKTKLSEVFIQIMNIYCNKLKPKVAQKNFGE